MSAMRGSQKPLPDDALELLSAWLDGELGTGEEDALLERLKKDPELRAQFEWFNLAGDALRSHEVAACHQPQLAVRVRVALESEPIRVAPGALAGSKLRRHLATGLTIAAAAGMLVVVAVPQLRGPDSGQTTAGGTGSGPTVVTHGMQPLNTASATAPHGTPQLDIYLRAHRELATTGVMPSAAAYIRMSGEPDR
jgi:sigma-E factor negative regulatory protein RseA